MRAKDSRRASDPRRAAEAVLRAPSKRKSDKADVMLIVRGYIDEQGDWRVNWEGMHWMRGLPPEHTTPSGLPAGFVGVAAQTLATAAAGDVLESHAGRMAKTLGENLGKGILDMLKK